MAKNNQKKVGLNFVFKTKKEASAHVQKNSRHNSQKDSGTLFGGIDGSRHGLHPHPDYNKHK